MLWQRARTRKVFEASGEEINAIWFFLHITFEDGSAGIQPNLRIRIDGRDTAVPYRTRTANGFPNR